MYQIIGPKFLITVTAWLTISCVVVFNYFGVHYSIRWVVIGLDILLLSILFSNFVWRLVWNKTGPLGRWLSKKIYPDLNGIYDVLLESNWPVVERMLDASRRTKEAFNPFDLDQVAPALLKVELEAEIVQTWFNITMTIRPKSTGAVIKSSRTLCTIPTRGAAVNERELIYMFEQENDSRAPTDDPNHEGAARLKIDLADSRILSGEYWNNRAWRRGVNAAGRLRLVRR